jgi:hypothetical protein
MRKSKALYFYAYIEVWVIGVVIPFICPIESDIYSRASKFITSGYNKIEGNTIGGSGQHFRPLLTLELTQFDALKRIALFKAKCADKLANIGVGNMKCDRVYVKQKQWRGTNLVDSAFLDFRDHREKDWNVKVDGNSSYFPLDTFTLVGYAGRSPFISINVSAPGFNQKISSQWEKEPSYSQNPENFYTILTIQFSRPWCTWLFSFGILGVVSLGSIYFAWLNRGSPQALIPLLLSLIQVWAIRQVFGVLPFPTFFDSLFLGIPLIGGVSTFLFFPTIKPRSTSRTRATF